MFTTDACMFVACIFNKLNGTENMTDAQQTGLERDILTYLSADWLVKEPMRISFPILVGLFFTDV